MSMVATTGLAEAARCGVHALIASLGATTAELKMPLSPAAASPGDGLGLQVPTFETKTLKPVAVRRSTKAVEILVPADVLEALLGVRGTGAISTAMDAVCAVVIDDESLLPSGVEVLEVAGGVCLYRLNLQPQPMEV